MSTQPSSQERATAPERHDFLSAQQVARELGVAKTSVYECLARGELAFHRIGRSIRIHRHDIDAFLNRTRVDVRPSQSYGSPATA